MNRIKFLPLCLSVAVMQSPVSSSNEEPFGPSLPDDTVFKLIPTSIITVMLTVVENRHGDAETSEECQQRAILNGAHFFLFRQDYCNYGTLLYPICSTPSGNQYELHVAEKFVTDGSPSDGAILKPLMTAQIVQSMPHQSFRVETPTILEIPEFITELDSSQEVNKLMLFTNDGKYTGTDGHYLIDPACYTNSSCGIPIITTAVELVSLRYDILHNVCGQMLDIGNEPGINLFSHENIGCKFFPEVYPVSNCEVTISGSGTLKVNATLVNFRETTCDGSELVVDTHSSDGTTNAVDVCTENAPTEFTATAGKVNISFSASAGQTGSKYGFIISITK